MTVVIGTVAGVVSNVTVSDGEMRAERGDSDERFPNIERSDEATVNGGRDPGVFQLQQAADPADRAPASQGQAVIAAPDEREVTGACVEGQNVTGMVILKTDTGGRQDDCDVDCGDVRLLFAVGDAEEEKIRAGKAHLRRVGEIARRRVGDLHRAMLGMSARDDLEGERVAVAVAGRQFAADRPVLVRRHRPGAGEGNRIDEGEIPGADPDACRSRHADGAAGRAWRDEGRDLARRIEGEAGRGLTIESHRRDAGESLPDDRDGVSDLPALR